jgi:hypothetical protein
MIFIYMIRGITGLEMNFVGKRNYLFSFGISNIWEESHLIDLGGMNKVDSIAAILAEEKLFVLL